MAASDKKDIWDKAERILGAVPIIGSVISAIFGGGDEQKQPIQYPQLNFIPQQTPQVDIQSAPMTTGTGVYQSQYPASLLSLVQSLMSQNKLRGIQGGM